MYKYVHNLASAGRRVDFQLTEEQRMIQSMVRDFAEKDVAPLA